MKSIYIFLLIICLNIWFLEKDSRCDSVGWGFFAGEPIGVTMKLIINSDNSLVSLLGWSFLNKEFQINLLNYQYRIKLTENIPLYIGAGLRIRINPALIKEFKMTGGMPLFLNLNTSSKNRSEFILN